MSDIGSPYVVVLVLSSAVTAGLAAYAWRRRPAPGATAFAATMALITLWAGAYAAGLVSHSRGVRLLWERVRFVGWSFAPVAWLAFALSYVGYDRFVSPRRIAALSVLPAVNVLAVWTNPTLTAFGTSTRAAWSVPVAMAEVQGLMVVDQSAGPVLVAFFLYSYLLMGTGTVVLVRGALTARGLYADQVLALTAGSLAPTVTSVLFRSGALTVVPGLDLAPYTFGVTGLLLGYAVFGTRVFDRQPATRRAGRDAVVREMPDGVVVLDEDDRVVDANPVARRVLGGDDGDGAGADGDAREEGTIVGAPVEEAFDSTTVVGDALAGEVIDTEAGRTYELRSSPLTDDERGGELGGTLVVLRDVTDRRNREQRLTVLNRVLRHNFRNDMNAIDGYATLLADQLDEPKASTAREIREVSQEVVELADKARDIERLMARRTGDSRSTPPVELVEEIVAEVTDAYPEAEATVSVGPDADAVPELPSQGILRPVLSNVVENAVEHNDNTRPSVDVTVDVVEDGPDRFVEFAVADDGPGIPDHEAEVLVEGTETPLKHGSGLGLWLVYWGAESLGGEVTFEDADPRGSVVTVRVPVGLGSEVGFAGDAAGAVPEDDGSAGTVDVVDVAPPSPSND